MRLICPNCDAQYEVPKEVMPPEGRDVQCSNCGQTWFQDHPDHPSEKPQPSDVEASPDDAFEAAATPDPADVTDQDDTEEHAFDAAVDDEAEDQPKLPERRELDPAVAEVLRAEAELEAEARRRETSVMESQPDLGLAETSKDSEDPEEPSRDQLAKLRREYLDEEDAQEELLATTATAALGSRRELLPDIEEINSSLRSNSDRSAATDPGQTAQVEEQEKRSSHLGFLLTIGIFVLLALLYVFAPNVAETLPQAAPALDAYVSTIDGWRAWLDTQLSATLKWLDEAALSSSQ